jgi:hypothetical protein
MSRKDGGDVRYVPPVLEVSGDGVRTRRLGKPGDSFELVLAGGRTESDSSASTVDSMTGGMPLRLPAVPGLPRLGEPETSAQAAGSGTRLRIMLGDVRKAAAGNAIAAKVTAIQIVLTQAPQNPENGQTDTSVPNSHGYDGTAMDRSRVDMDLGVGLLEAAAVAPAPRSGSASGGMQGAVSAGGTGGGLPITGSPVALVIIGGGALIIAGAAALAVGGRRRRFQP